MKLLNAILWPFRKGIEEISTPFGRVIGQVVYGGYGSLSKQQSASVSACVLVIKSAIMSLPSKVLVHGDKNFADMRSHKVWRILNKKPNPFQTPSIFLSQIIEHQLMRGNYYGWINRVNGSPVEIIPLNPDHIEVRQRPDWELEYVWRRPGFMEVVIPSRDILHIPDVNMDGIKGISRVEWCRETVDFDNTMRNHGIKFFKNNATPSTVLTMQQPMADDKRKQMQEDWEKNQSGENKFRTAVLTGGVDIKTLTMTSADAQFLEQQKFTSGQIAVLFGVAPHMIGLLDRATFSNIEHQTIQFYIQTLMGLLKRIEDEINIKLFEEDSGYYVKFNERALMRGDAKTQADVLHIERFDGIINANEWRALKDMGPIDGGEVYWQPVNMMKLGSQNVTDGGIKP